MTPEELERSWVEMLSPSPESDLNGVRVPGLGIDLPVYLARDGKGRRHLLVSIDPGTEPMRDRPARGLEVTTDRLRVGHAPECLFIDLLCVEPAQHNTFSSVALDIIRAIASAKGDARSAVERSLDRWRWFWSVDPAGLSKEAALGLFGELWFLERWMGAFRLETLQRWQGPTGARHDFQWAEHSVEVKAAVGGPGGVVHHISNLDQLDDPVTGDLSLFSLQVVEDALSSNTLPSLVQRLEASMAAEEDASRLLARLIGKVGYNPAHADRYQRPLRVVSEELYKVEGGFPRLTRKRFPGGLPAGIDALSYSLAMAACASWRIAMAPSDNNASFLRD
jgi:hypothetical protein